MVGISLIFEWWAEPVSWLTEASTIKSSSAHQRQKSEHVMLVSTSLQWRSPKEHCCNSLLEPHCFRGAETCLTVTKIFDRTEIISGVTYLQSIEYSSSWMIEQRSESKAELKFIDLNQCSISEFSKMRSCDWTRVKLRSIWLIVGCSEKCIGERGPSTRNLTLLELEWTSLPSIYCHQLCSLQSILHTFSKEAWHSLISWTWVVFLKAWRPSHA